MPRLPGTMAERRRRVLMLVSALPPGPQVVLRTFKFARYLPGFGWLPVGLTARQNRTLAGEDIEQLPWRLRARQTPRFPTPSQVARSALRTRDVVVTQRGVRSGPGLRTTTPPRLSGLRRLLAILDTPDDFVGWLPFALLAGHVIASRNRIAVIHASGPPFSVVWAGALLSRWTGLPLVADFRDTWTLDAQDPFGSIGGSFQAGSSATRLRLLQRLEAWCLGEARAVLFTSEATMRLYQTHYPGILGRCHLILNGFDPEDFSQALAHQLPRPTIAHVGTLHEYQRAQVASLFEAVALASREISDLQLALVGPIGSALRDDLLTVARQLGVESRLSLTGPVPHVEAVRWLRAVDLLLLFAGDNPFIRLSKISEYVAAGRPMMAFARPESQTARDVREHGAEVLYEASLDLIAQRLAEGVRRGLESRGLTAAVPLRHPHPLNRRTEAQELAEILNAVSRH